MISTRRDQTSWNRKDFKFKLQKNGYCSRISFACCIVFSIFAIVSILPQKSIITFKVNEGVAKIKALEGGAAQNDTSEVEDSRKVASQTDISEVVDSRNASSQTNTLEVVDSRNVYSQTETSEVVDSRNVSSQTNTPEVVDSGVSSQTNTSELLDSGNVTSQTDTSEFIDSEKNSSEQLLDGHFAPGFDKESCLSRYEATLYRKPLPYKPSPYLLSKLRTYESLHNHCAPYTISYNKTIEQLKSGRTNVSTTDCKYVIYTPLSGLGNRMLSVASAFLYALLTNRVLLVDFGIENANLFCEPFPNTTWLLPWDFPIRNQFHNFSQEYLRTYGNMLKNRIIKSPMKSPPPFLYLYLAYNIDRFDELFYCDKNQAQLRKVPLLVIRSNQYFVPSLFLIQSFQRELSKLFPDDQDTVFHHLGRYLFQPSNEAWGVITRFYQAYLSKAEERIGIQVRVFDTKATPFQTVMDQIMSCALKEKLLPEVLDEQKPVASMPNNQSLKAVLVTSLYPEYYEHIKGMYWTQPTVSGEVIGVYQPSHEEHELYGDNMHSMKAWTEIYLLSMNDVLVTSSWSTFGYVAQSLGGLKPWILYKPLNGTTPDPPCVKAMSMEPCFHFPPSYGCRAKSNVLHVVPHVKHCEDVDWGLKLVKDH